MPSLFRRDQPSDEEQLREGSRVATESCCQISQFGSHYLELPSHDSLLDSDYCPLSKASLGFVLRHMKTTSLSSLGCCETDNRIGR